MQDRGFVGGGFLNQGLLGGRRKFSLSPVHGFAHIYQRSIQVVVRVKLNHDGRRILRTKGFDFINTLDRAQFCFEWHHQQTFRVFGSDTLVYDGNGEHWDLYLRLAFDGNRIPGDHASDQDHHHDKHGRSRPMDRSFNNLVHETL